MNIPTLLMKADGRPMLGSPRLSAEALLSRLPVDDLPDGLEVLGLAVLVLKAVGEPLLAIACFIQCKSG